MKLLYMKDGDASEVIALADLAARFDEGGLWERHLDVAGLREELESRGWFEGIHPNGHWLAIRMDKLLHTAGIGHMRVVVERAATGQCQISKLQRLSKQVLEIIN
jgi:hypothetical protein